MDKIIFKEIDVETHFVGFDKEQYIKTDIKRL